MAAAKKYDVSSLENFEGLDAVRKKPAMYIGPTDSNGIWIITKEAADNTTDEFLAGRNKSCHIILAPDNSIWVLDDGKGMPVGMTEMKSGEKINSLTMIVSKLHAGGKFGKGAYSASIGTHGVGIKATNALSEVFEVYTNYEGTWWHTEFNKGVEKSGVKKAKAPPVSHGIEMKRGTAIHFKPDASIFSKGSKFEPKQAAEWCRLTAYLNAGYKTTFTDSTGKTKTWCFPNGVKDYLTAKIEQLSTKTLGKAVLHVSEENIDLAVAFTQYDGIAIESYTNSSKNADGGVHVTAFYAALGKAIEPYKLRSHKFTPSDLREGLVGIVNYKIAEPQFSSQTKEKLVDTRVSKPCEETCFKALQKFFADNKTLAKEICKRAADLKALKDQFSENKKALQELSKAAKNGKFHPKHVRVDCADDLRELYACEGDSAYGTSKEARDQRFQEVIPMKGKIHNVMRKGKQDKALASDEVLGLLVGIGFDPSAKDPFSRLRVGKFIFLCDADSDGSHINTLLLALFVQLGPEIFQKGKIFIAVPPEYMVTLDGKRIYGTSTEDCLKKTNGKAKNIRHYKGLGEMDAEILAETAFNPATRRLYQIKTVEKGHMVEFRKLMEDDADYRKEMLGV